MARQPNVQYVHAYAHGSAARKLEPQPKKKNKVQLPQPKVKVRRDKRKVIHLDPLSICAIGAAGLLLVAMAVGMSHLGITNAQAKQLEGYIAQLQEENAKLQETYKSGYDLKQIEERAMDLGMIPADDAQHVIIDVEIPDQNPEPTLWENIGLFLKELFA